MEESGSQSATERAAISCRDNILLKTFFSFSLTTPNLEYTPPCPTEPPHPGCLNLTFKKFLLFGTFRLGLPSSLVLLFFFAFVLTSHGVYDEAI